MKCPNCNNEALFVNGKYVCVDCGIEITPEQQAAQYQVDDFSANLIPQANAPILDVNEPAQEEVAPIVPQPTLAPEPNPAPEPAVVNEVPLAQPIEKPVEEAIRSELEAEELPKAEEASTGVYDFGQPANEGTVPVSEPQVVATEGPAEVQIESPTQEEMVAELSSIQPAPQPEIAINTAPLAEPQNNSQSADYFQPNTFDIKNNEPNTSQDASSVPETLVVPETNVSQNEKFDAYSTPSGIGAGEPTVGNLQGGQDVGSAEPVEAPIQAEPVVDALPQTETSALMPASQSLDDMLNTGTTESQSEMPPITYPAPPVDGMQAGGQSPQSGLTPEGVTAQQQMPSIESVFGNGGNNGSGDTPTPQDFGLPAPEPENDKKKWFIIGGVVGGIILLIVILLFVFLGGNKSPYPITLNTEQVTTLSSKVSEVMDKVSESSVEYDMTADFTGLSVDTDVSDEESEKLLQTFEKGIQTSGIWLMDDEENIYVSSVTNTISDKKTYIKRDKVTHVYSEEESKWNEKEGDQTINIPPFFAPQSQGAVLYGTNIQSASLVGVESIDAVEYKTYEIKPSQGATQNLAFLGNVFTGAGFSSVNVDNLRITVSVAPDYRIRKVSISGYIDIQTEKFAGKISLSGEAEYSYQDVVIQKPSTSATGDPPNEVSANNQGGKEEGKPSSVVNEVLVEEVTEEVGVIETVTDEVIEARG